MKKSTKVIIIICAVALALGLVLMIAALAKVDFDFSRLGEDEVYTEVVKSEEILPTDSILISTDTERIKLGRSEDDLVHIKYSDSESRQHEYSYSDGQLSLRLYGDDVHWHELISFNFGFTDRVIEVMLPSSFNGNVTLTATTGEVEIVALSTEGSVNVSTSTGSVDIDASQLQPVQIATTTGNISFRNSSASALMAACTTGGISINNMTADSVLLTSSTGRITLSALTCDKVEVACTTGGIRLDTLKSADISLKSSTGDIKGSISMPATDFTIESATSTGSNNLFGVNYGGPNKLFARASTGDISISFNP